MTTVTGAAPVPAAGPPAVAAWWPMPFARRGWRRIGAAAALLLALSVGVACDPGSGGSRGAGLGSDTGRPAADAPPSPSTGGAAPAPSLRWSRCEGGECARLAVPLDHRDPTGASLRLALFRVAARHPGDRIGALLLNPGGPGGSGIDFLRQAVHELPGELRDRFDLVAWDPRGAGRSDPVDCGPGLDAYFAVDTSPETEAEWDAAEGAARSFADACRDGSGTTLLSHVDTLSTVRDMDLIRAALGEPKLTYLGYSYGTLLGAFYAQEFPQRVRALVLDGAVDPSVPPERTAVQQAQGFEQNLRAFLAACGRDVRCAFARGGDPLAAYDRIMRAVDREPLKVATSEGVRLLGPSEADMGVAAALYSRDSWPYLAQALDAAARGDGSVLLDFFDQYVERRPDGTYGTQWTSFISISCVDGPAVPGGAAGFRRIAEAAAAAAPHFGRANVVLGLPCAFWSVPPVLTTGPVDAPDAPTVVVIGTSRDPATPLVWSEGLARQLGARLVVHDGEGHTAFPQGDRCLDPAVISYLVSTELPRAGLRCG